MSSNPEPTKVALITGAAGGIGHALVHEFIASGYTVIATDIADKPESLSCHHYIQADLSRYVAEEPFAREINLQINKLCNGRLSALINNAAVQIIQRVELLTREDWQHTINVNLLAPFFLTQALLPQLSEAAGSVINISSIHARLTKTQFTAYATSKAALSAITRSSSLELARRIRVNAIEPAAIETEMLRNGLSSHLSVWQRLKDCHPAGRIGGPSEVAKAAIWLCSGDSDFINGACLRIDGGLANVLHDPEQNIEENALPSGSIPVLD